MSNTFGNLYACIVNWIEDETRFVFIEDSPLAPVPACPFGPF